jgi:hypothetical protein
MISISLSLPGPFLLRTWWNRHERLLSLIGIFVLSVCCGCFLLQIIGPRAHTLPLWLWLPLPLAWWVLVIPAASYLLLGQFLRDWPGAASSPAARKDTLPVALHLSSDELENRARRSGQIWQRRAYHALSLAVRGYTPTEIMRMTHLKEAQLIGLVFHYNVWGPRVLRARTGQLVFAGCVSQAGYI